jgi:polyferredoxin
MDKEKSKSIGILALGIIALSMMTYLILQQQVRKKQVYFWSTGYFYSYFYIIYGLLIIGFIFLILNRLGYLDYITKYLKYPYYLIFLPVAIFPVIRCYFRVPYIFCAACPKKCPWGELRPVIIPAFLLQNIYRRFWCFKLCPLGTLQDWQFKVSPKKISLPGWTRWIRYAILAFVIFVVTMIFIGINDPTDGPFFINSYDAVWITVIIFAAIFLLAFMIPRFWCNYFCPIGSFSDIVLKIERRIEDYRERKSTRRNDSVQDKKIDDAADYAKENASTVQPDNCHIRDIKVSPAARKTKD